MWRRDLLGWLLKLHFFFVVVSVIFWTTGVFFLISRQDNRRAPLESSRSLTYKAPVSQIRIDGGGTGSQYVKCSPPA